MSSDIPMGNLSRHVQKGFWAMILFSMFPVMVSGPGLATVTVRVLTSVAARRAQRLVLDRA